MTDEERESMLAKISSMTRGDLSMFIDAAAARHKYLGQLLDAKKLTELKVGDRVSFEGNKRNPGTIVIIIDSISRGTINGTRANVGPGRWADKWKVPARMCTKVL